MRRLTTALLCVAVVPAAVVLPTVSAPAPATRPVAPAITALPLAATPRAVAPASESGTAVAAPADGPVVLTPEQDTDPFDLVALTWEPGTAPVGTQVQVRVREDGRWSSWQVLGGVDEGPDDATAEGARAALRDGTAPLLTDGADGVQIRVDTPDGSAPRGLQAQLINGGESPADGVSTGAPSAAQAAAATPAVITRAQWGADESLRTGTPTYNSKVKALVLHHTAGTNSYSSSGAYAELRATYAYHTKVRGWSDLGYNILVDRYGRIYEGRKGSITEAVMGAHSGGFNTHTFGVSVMGNFDVASPPSAVITALKKVIAWKAEEFGINPTASTQLTSSGGGTSRYAAGVTVTKATVMGHKDVGQTACPGRYLYPYLSTLRSYAASVVAPAVSGLTVSPTDLDHGTGPVTATARLAMGHTWTMTVTSFCGGTVRSLSGSAARGTLAARWDGKDSGGQFVPPGIYTLDLRLTSRWGAVTTLRRDVEVLTTTTSPPSACAARRLAGIDRYATSVIVGREAFPSATSAVVVNGTAQADGVVAGPLAFANSAPLLLVTPTGLPAVVKADLTRRHVTRVWIVGSTAVVPPLVEDQLRALGVTTVTRLAGATRFGTAAAVATALGAPHHAAFVASGLDANLIDAVTAGGAAARLQRPILLVTPTTVPTETRAAVQGLGITTAAVLGSSSAVSEPVSTALGALGVASRVRLGGTDRYATAAAVASGTAGDVGTDQISVAGGAAPTVVDAVLAGQRGRLTLLTTANAVPASTTGWLAARNPSGVTLVGGPDLVPTSALRALATAAVS